MDFSLTEEQRMIQDTARKFAITEIQPKAKEYDRKEIYPRDICIKAAENGLVGPVIPEKYGGSGLGWLEASIICEQLSRVDLGIAQAILFFLFGCPHILAYGNNEQNFRYLTFLASA